MGGYLFLFLTATVAACEGLICSFESDFCGLSQGSMDDFDWSRSNGSKLVTNTEPYRDHTTGHGFYIFIDTSSPRQGEKAQLFSGIQNSTDLTGICLTFWYHLYGPHLNTLNLYMQTGTTPGNQTLLWTRSVSTDNIWKQGRKQIRSQQPYQVVFEGVVEDSCPGDIAIDDISLEPGQCPVSDVCDFEENECGYTQDPNDIFDWIRHRNETSSFDTGPSYDHTTGNGAGYYMHIKTSSPRVGGDTARMTSPSYPPTQAPKCLKFWYHMYGSQVGTLNVYIKSQGIMGSPVWSRNFNQGNQWHHGTADISMQNAWKVIFEGVVGAGYQGDIAIDDISIVDGKCPAQGSCTFEDDWCGYSNGHNSKYNWLRSSSVGLPPGNKAPVDHTTGTNEGLYMFVEASPRNQFDRAWLYSEYLSPTTQSCLTFWYFMYGDNVGALRVYQALPSKSTSIWDRRGNQGQVWNNTQINISSIVSYQIIFDAETGSSNNSYIAIDDVAITPGSCYSVTTTPASVLPTVIYPQTFLDCNFDRGSMCTWHQETLTDTFDWILRHNPTASRNFVPMSDHTTETYSGHYIYIEPYYLKKNATARIISPSFVVNSVGKCFKFYYHMYGGHVGRLSLYAMQGTSIGEAVFTRVGNQGNQWLYGGVYLTPQTLSSPKSGPTTVQLVLEGKIDAHYEGDIAVDDLSLNDGPCPLDQTCDFQSSNICNYRQDVKDNFDWTRAHGSASQSGSGPNTDHTYGTFSGYYMYIDTSSPRRVGDKARLLGHHFRQVRDKCLQFFYHMSGHGMGTLNIYFKKHGYLGHPVWTRSGNQGKDWIPGEVNLNSDVPLEVIFEGTVGTVNYSDIAIDDINMQNRPCPYPGSCDFEVDICNWANDVENDDLDWLRSSHRSFKTGPNTDHTIKSANGYYMYIESSGSRMNGDKAKLKSEVLRMTDGGCLTFWYNMYGVGSGTLNVYLISVANPNSPLQKLWLRTGNQGPRWHDAAVSIRSSDEFRIMFEGILGTGPKGSIAIDDLMVTPGLCSSGSVPLTFICRDGQTVSADRVCNFISDCSDNSDEDECGSCDFETGLCSWEDISNGSFMWQRGQNSSLPGITSPGVDHTKGTSYGYFMFIDSNDGTSNGEATLVSPTMRQSSATCQMQFYYMNYFGEYYNGEISVSIQIGSRITEIYMTKVQTYRKWIGASVYIGRIIPSFKILMKATKSFNSPSIVAVDDVSFINCVAPSFQSSCTQFRCFSGACVDKSRICDGTEDCGDNSDESEHLCTQASTCDFENSFCQWIQSTDDNYDWLRHEGLISSSQTGPKRDHTTNMNSGHYISIKTSSAHKPGDKAQLLSGVIQPATVTDGCALTFYYHMNGEGTETLNVYMLTEQGGHLQKIWSKTGSLGYIWERARISLVNSEHFRLVLEGVHGSTYSGEISVDDTIISPKCMITDVTLPSPLYPLTSAATSINPCSNGGHLCGNGPCIAIKRVCDYTPDCTDHSDERNCGPCDFEKDNCGWTDTSTGRFSWNLTSVVSATGKGPTSDHTMSSKQGHYIYVQGSSDGVFYSPAILQSPPLTAPSQYCQMFFYENVNGRNSGVLQVGAMINGTFRIYNTYRPNPYNPYNSTSTWYKRIVYLGRFSNLSNGYRVQFRFLPTDRHVASQALSTAIDDISFKFCDPKLFPPSPRCNFERNLCSWIQSHNDQFDWQRKSGSTSSVTNGPVTDHTTGKTGYYIYIDTSSPRQTGDTASIETPLLPPTLPIGNCFTFWYYLFGPTTGSLTVHLNTFSNSSVFWSKSGTHGGKWMKGQRTLVSNMDYKLYIEATVGNGHQGIIALDDIAVTKGVCPPERGCDFEEGWCNWQQSLQDEFNWTIGNNGTPSVGTGPKYDHTYGSNTAHYAYASSSLSSHRLRKGDRAILVSPIYSGDKNTSSYYANYAGSCLTFWYHMHVGRLNVYQKDNGTLRHQLGYLNGDQGNPWRKASISIVSDGDVFQIEFEAVIGASDTGDIAIDDIVLNDGHCLQEDICSFESFKTTENRSKNKSLCALGSVCDFEQSFCHWTQSSKDNSDWLRRSGSTSSGPTGPTRDHTTNLNSGHYIYIETLSLHGPEEKAQLQSNVIQAASLSDGCTFTFSFYMYGVENGTINVYMLTERGGYLQKVWSNTGNNGNIWEKATISLVNSKNFQLILEGVYGSTYSGEIAVDDTIFSNNCTITDATLPTALYPPTTINPCNVHEYKCSNGVCINLKRMCDITDDCGDNSDEKDPTCEHYKIFDFEDNFRNFIQGRNGIDDDFDWIRWNGSTPSRTTGPESDHSTGLTTGHYMYMEASAPRKYNEKAWLMTKPLIPTVGKNCNIRFYYYMYGKFINQLNIYSRIYNSGTPTHLIWSVTGNKGAVWQRADISLNNSNSFQVIIEGKIGDSYLGDIAIDDVSFTPDCQYSGQSLPNPPVVLSASTLTPLTTVSHSCDLSIQFSCHSTGKCIDKIKQCDFREDCSDGSDEEKCVHSITTFEGGNMGNWKLNLSQSSSGLTYSWQVTQASSSLGDPLRPRTDHTNNATSAGWFLWADSSPGDFKDTAILYTPYIGYSGPQCTLKFFYYESGVVGHLEVYMATKQEKLLIWSNNGDQGKTWQQAVISIGHGENFYLILQATRGYSYTGDISVDDVYFLNCAPPTVSPNRCDRTKYSCANGNCIDLTTQCNYVNDCGDNSDETKSLCDATYPGRCDFEEFICPTWTQESSADFNWTLNMGSTTTPNTGPSFDHTTHTSKGHYLYIESSAPRKPGQKARLSSLPIKGTSKNCSVSLWYNMNGAGVGNLNIFKRFDQAPHGLVLINSFTTPRGNVWIRTLDILDGQGGAGDYRVVIEATVGKNYLGDIAIDDISLTPGCKSGAFLPGQVTTASAPCGSGQHICANGICYNISQQCNFHDDCGDQTDEGFCGTSCDFEKGLCGWKIANGENYAWILQNGSAMSASNGSFSDHTLGNSNGHFLHVAKVSDRVPYGRSAILVSSVYTQSDSNCQLSFWYKMYGQNPGSILVLAEMENRGYVSLWSNSDNHTSTWQQGSVVIGARRNFAILFVANRDKGYQGDIAIDDILLTKCSADFSNTTTTTRGPTTDHVHVTTGDFRQAIQLKCLHHGWMVTVDLRKLSTRPSDIGNIYLSINTCTGALQGDLLVFNQTYGECNTHHQAMGENMTFSNYLIYAIPDTRHQVSDVQWEFKIQCSHPLSAHGTFHITPEHNAMKQGSSSGVITGSPIDISLYKDSNFKNSLDGKVPVGTPVYVQVLSLSHPDVVMVLDSCAANVKATHPDEQKTFPLIKQHVEPTTNVLTIRNQITRFKFDMFDLPEDDDGIYVTCDVHFCDQMDLSPRCDQRCEQTPSVRG